MSPLSVVMPIYNAASYLDASIESILGQTLGDFEFVIVDDASTDGSLEIVRAWAGRDPRIRVLVNPERCGVEENGNRAVGAARGAVCARMDADDVSHPERLRAEWEVLRDGADVVLVAALADYIDAGGRKVRSRDRWRLVRPSGLAPFAHGSTMFRREVFLEVGGYRAACHLWSDFDLYCRMAERGRIVVLPNVLYRHRLHSGSFSGQATLDQLADALALRDACIAVRRSGRGGDPVMEAVGSNGTGHRGGATVNAFHSLASRRIWAGHAPRVLGSVLAAQLPLDRALARLLVLAACGAVSPIAVRFLLRTAVRVRDLAVGPLMQRHRPVEWRCG